MLFFYLSIIAMMIALMASLLKLQTPKNLDKSSFFECGFDPFSISRSPFSLRFFKLGILFIYFDIEVILILGAPLFSNHLSLFYITHFLSVLMIILLGLLFEWHQKTLNWIK